MRGGNEMANWLSKQEFMEKHNYSSSTYFRRMQELKNTSIFRKAYRRVTSIEVAIDDDLYEVFLSYKAANRLRNRKIKPDEFLAQEGIYVANQKSYSI